MLTDNENRAACDRMGVTQSMGRAGSALDNAVIESWHSTLELELRGPGALRHQGGRPGLDTGEARSRRRDDRAVLAGVKAKPLRVACGQP